MKTRRSQRAPRTLGAFVASIVVHVVVVQFLPWSASPSAAHAQRPKQRVVAHFKRPSAAVSVPIEPASPAVVEPVDTQTNDAPIVPAAEPAEASQRPRPEARAAKAVGRSPAKTATPEGAQPESAPADPSGGGAGTAPVEMMECKLESGSAATGSGGGATSGKPGATPTAPTGPTAPMPGDADDLPTLLGDCSGKWTAAARAAGREGTVVVSLVVTAAGDAREIRIARGLSPELDDAALETVKRCRFRPARIGGKAVDYTLPALRVRFVLDD